jgi:MFS family permease
MFIMQTLINKSLLQKNIWKFYLSTFFGSWSFATGFLVFYYRELGFSYIQIFLIGIVYELLNFVLEIPTGVLADFWSRKRVIVIGYLVSGLSFFIVLIKPEAYGTYILWSVLSAICTTLNSGSVDAYIYDTVQAINPDEYPKVISRISAISLVVQAISFLIGGWVADSLGFNYALLLSGIGGVLQTIVIFTTYEPPVNNKEVIKKIESAHSLLKQFTRQITTSFKVLFQNHITRTMLLYGIVFFLLMEFVRIIYQPYFSELGFNTKSAISLLSASFLIISALSGIVISKINTRKNEKLLLIFFSIGLCLPLLLLSFPTVSMVAFILFYIAVGGGQVIIPTIMNRYLPSDKRATILSAQNQIGSLSYAIFALLIGNLIDRVNIPMGALFVGLLFSLSFLFLLAGKDLKDDH